jgi:hypothetical protein
MVPDRPGTKPTWQISATTGTGSTAGARYGVGRTFDAGLDSDGGGHRVCIGDTISPTSVRRLDRKDIHMEYGIGGILILILVILAIIYFAKRV